MSASQNRPVAESQQGGFVYERVKQVADIIGNVVLFFAAGAASLAVLTETNTTETITAFDDATMHPLDTDI